MDAGWHKSRSVDHRFAIERLGAEGYVLADWFTAVVGEFDGLTIDFQRNGRSDQVVLAPSEAARRWYPANIANYAERVGQSLLPIGYSYHEHLVLLVAELGQWFAGHDDELWRIGGSAQEAVERLVIGSGFEPVD